MPSISLPNSGPSSMPCMEHLPTLAADAPAFPTGTTCGACQVEFGRQRLCVGSCILGPHLCVDRLRANASPDLEGHSCVYCTISKLGKSLVAYEFASSLPHGHNPPSRPPSCPRHEPP
ncbi:hypothetical protein VTK56DRAFT_3307 [Thermocarpiscus australiensis]